MLKKITNSDSRFRNTKLTSCTGCQLFVEKHFSRQTENWAGDLLHIKKGKQSKSKKIQQKYWINQCKDYITLKTYIPLYFGNTVKNITRIRSIQRSNHTNNLFCKLAFGESHCTRCNFQTKLKWKCTLISNQLGLFRASTVD